MKLVFAGFSTLLLSAHLSAFEPAQLSLDSVSNFEAGDKSFTVRHRFYGQADDLDTFFGMDEGANTFLSLRYAPLKALIFEVHHAREKSEDNIRIGYAHKFKYLNTQFNLNGFQFEEANVKDKRENLFFNAVFQTPLVFKHLRVTSNIGYDGYYDKTGLGIGLELSTQNFIPTTLSFTQTMSILAEYYSKHKNLEGFNKKYNSYAFGLKFGTYGHHFELLFSNSSAADPRTMMQGTNTNDLHFAFNINRKF